MTLGVAFCVRSHLGSSVISVLPYVFETAGKQGLVPILTIGQYTYIMNAVLGKHPMQAVLKSLLQSPNFADKKYLCFV